MVAQWRSPTWRGARHVRKIIAQNLDKKVPVFLLASDASMSRDAVKKLASKTMGPVFRNPPMSVFFGFDRPAAAPMVHAHHPAAPPRGRGAARHRAAWHQSCSSPGGARPRRRRPGTFSSRAPCMMGMPPGAISHPIGKKIRRKTESWNFFQTLPNASPRVQERYKKSRRKSNCGDFFFRR